MLLHIGAFVIIFDALITVVVLYLMCDKTMLIIYN